MMTTTMRNIVSDIKTMFWRSLLKTLRTPEAMVMSIMIPAILMLLFVNVFGGSMDVGDYNFANFIVPGILLNSLIQGSASTAISMNQDMTTGIINRFRTMAISHSSLLIGHVLAAVVKTIMTTIVVLLVAILAGFRPAANLAEWSLVVGLLILFIFTVTWFAVLLGALMKDSESASGITQLVAILVFLSSGFSPTENMPRFLRYFAENQPMTPFINSLRALMNGYEITENNLQLALIWWGGILLISFLVAVFVYKKKMTV